MVEIKGENLIGLNIQVGLYAIALQFSIEKKDQWPKLDFFPIFLRLMKLSCDFFSDNHPSPTLGQVYNF
jgi:hypothetical protein